MNIDHAVTMIYKVSISSLPRLGCYKTWPAGTHIQFTGHFSKVLYNVISYDLNIVLWPQFCSFVCGCCIWLLILENDWLQWFPLWTRVFFNSIRAKWQSIFLNYHKFSLLHVRLQSLGHNISGCQFGSSVDSTSGFTKVVASRRVIILNVSFIWNDLCEW